MPVAQSQINPEKEFQPADEECRLLVARIVASPDFQRAARLRAFLSYVVEQKLAGRSEEINEVLIGHPVFGRRPSYNPGDDSIVRTEARTLRQRLQRYFAGAPEEPFVLEIPRGGYLPVLRPRLETAPAVCESPAATPPPNAETHQQILLSETSRRRWIAMGASAAAVSAIGIWLKRDTLDAARANVSSAHAPPDGHAQIGLESSDQRLIRAFTLAKERALSSIFTGDPVGDWYASNRDNRAFCMRDTVHEMNGATLLGLYPHSPNMLRRFAASIAGSRRWCGYWIITKDGFPSPSDYSGDDNFSYSLPANFDLVRAFHRQLRWTGDRQYLDPVFTSFCDRTVSQFVQRGTRIATALWKGRRDCPRVSASYNQQEHFLTGADLLSAHYGGYLAYAAIQEMKGGPGSLSQRIAREHRDKAEALRKRFNADWWDAEKNCFRAGVMPDGSWCDKYVATCNVYALKFGTPDDGVKAEAALDLMDTHRPPFDSTFSHYPEVLYRYGRNDSAYRYLLEIADPSFSGYKMSETAFAAIGSIGTGLMGIDPDTTQSSVETMPRLPREMSWVRITNVPVGDNQVTVEHQGNSETHFTNRTGGPLMWRAVFPIPATGNSAGIFIDGTAAAKLTIEQRPNRQAVICASAPVNEGRTRVAKLVA